MKTAIEKPPEKEPLVWLNESQVSEMTGLSVHTLRAHRQRKTGIPYAKIGRSVRYSRLAVTSFMTSHEIAL